MVLLPPASRPSETRTLGNHEKRLRALERVLASLGWRFDFDNQGGWGKLTFRGATPGSSGDTGFELNVLAEDGGAGDWEINVEGNMLATVGGFVIAELGGNTFQLTPAGFFYLLAAGGVFKLFDSGGNPILQMTDGSPDLHLPTGGSVIFDL